MARATSSFRKSVVAMGKTRLRTKLVLSLIFTTALLTGASLLIAQNYFRKHARLEIPHAIATFQQSDRQWQKAHQQSAAIYADYPVLRNLMSTNDPDTIQVSSVDTWQMFGSDRSDLFLLADQEGRIMALHSTGVFDRRVARASLAQTLQQRRSRDWWFEGGQLYEVFLQKVYRGTVEDDVPLGVLVVGYAVDQGFAASVAQITSSEVVFRYGDAVVASSLGASQQQDLLALEGLVAGSSPIKPEELLLGGQRYFAGSIALPPASTLPVTLTVLKSYDAAILFLHDVNRLLLGVGIVGLIAGSLLMFLISDTFTRPLSRLATGVVALEKGDFSYPLNLRRQDEIGELTIAFDTMRKSLRDSQQHLLQAERLATIGRMASTISHDLRHPLTTVLAYAELLSEGNLDNAQREEMYLQIRSSVNNMAELIASLLEFSKAQEALRLSYGDCMEPLQDTIRAVKLKPEFRRIQLTLLHEGPTQGWFDFAKLGRAFSNLLRNACEAVTPDSGRVSVVAVGANNHVEISVSDNGSGIPEKIRDDVFQPFVTYGKADGTGLGLAVVQKIVLDHGGEVAVESTGSQGTTFKLTLPLTPR
jgi:signal transduction histidine kinase